MVSFKRFNPDIAIHTQFYTIYTNHLFMTLHFHYFSPMQILENLNLHASKKPKPTDHEKMYHHVCSICSYIADSRMEQ